MRSRVNVQTVSRTAALAAAIFLLAYFVKIPFAGGYVHPGDGAVLAAAFWLPAPWAACASALALALADVAAGYMVYAPATAIIKALMALAAALVIKKRPTTFGLVLAALAGGAVNVLGYFAADCIMTAQPLTALTYVPFNILQSVFSGLLFVVLAKAADRIGKK